MMVISFNISQSFRTPATWLTSDAHALFCFFSVRGNRGMPPLLCCAMARMKQFYLLILYPLFKVTTRGKASLHLWCEWSIRQRKLCGLVKYTMCYYLFDVFIFFFSFGRKLQLEDGKDQLDASSCLKKCSLVFAKLLLLCDMSCVQSDFIFDSAGLLAGPLIGSSEQQS